MENINKTNSTTEQIENKSFQPDVGIYVLTDAFPDKFKVEELKKHFGYAKSVVVNSFTKKMNDSLQACQMSGDLRPFYFKIPTKKDRDIINANKNKPISLIGIKPLSPLNRDYECLKKIQVMRFVLDLHGGEDGELSLEDRSFFLRCLNGIKDFLDERPGVKLYIENLACHSAKEINGLDIENLIKNTFQDTKYEDRIFYAKLKDKNYSACTFRKDNGAFAHIMVENNFSKTADEIKEMYKKKETNPAFEYFYLKDDRFIPYRSLLKNSLLLKAKQEAKKEAKNLDMDLLSSKAEHEAKKIVKNLDINKPFRNTNSSKKQLKMKSNFKTISMDFEQKKIEQKNQEDEKKNKKERIGIRKKIADYKEAINNTCKNEYLLDETKEISKQSMQRGIDDEIKNLNNYRIKRSNTMEYSK